MLKTYTRTALSLRRAQRATRQSPGREDGRNGAVQTQPARLWRLCHRAGANTDVAERYYPKKHLPAQAPRLTAETETIVLVMRRNEGVPPYRRIRPQTKRLHLTKKTLFNQSCHRTSLSLRGAQRATRQSPGSEYGRGGTVQTQPARPRRLCAPRKKSHSDLHRRQNTIIQFSEV